MTTYDTELGKLVLLVVMAMLIIVPLMRTLGTRQQNRDYQNYGRKPSPPRRGSVGIIGFLSFAVVLFFLYAVFSSADQLRQDDVDQQAKEQFLHDENHYESRVYQDKPVDNEYAKPEPLPPKIVTDESPTTVQYAQVPTARVNVSPYQQNATLVSDVDHPLSAPQDEVPAGTWYVQIAALPSQAAANQKLEEWALSYQTMVKLGYDESSYDYPYKVLIGPFTSKSLAIKTLGIQQAWVRDLRQESSLTILP